MQNKLVKSLSVLFLAILAASASAADAPKRKAGLWEMNTRMAGMPGGMPMQMCVDQATDNLLQQQAKGKQDCSTMEVKPGVGSTTIKAVCRAEGTTMTMDAVFTGNFDTGYKSVMKMSYNPPVAGMKEMTVNQEARWLGPCKPGQKPGEVIMVSPSGAPINMNEMMKSPQMQEMMKQQRNAK